MAFVLWLAMATIQDPRRPGTGFLPSSLAVGRLDFGWTTPVGGSQALLDALRDPTQVVRVGAVVLVGLMAYYDVVPTWRAVAIVPLWWSA